MPVKKTDQEKNPFPHSTIEFSGIKLKNLMKEFGFYSKSRWNPLKGLSGRVMWLELCCFKVRHMILPTGSTFDNESNYE